MENSIEILIYGYKIKCSALDYHAEFEIRSEQNGAFEIEATGSIKWDGCANFNSECLHFCGSDHFERFSKAISFCYAFAENNIKEWLH